MYSRVGRSTAAYFLQNVLEKTVCHYFISSLPSIIVSQSREMYVDFSLYFLYKKVMVVIYLLHVCLDGLKMQDVVNLLSVVVLSLTKQLARE